MLTSLILALAIKFPPHFVWGTATAAVQVEGGTVHSDWESFCAKPGVIRDGDRVGDATKHWELYDQDFAQAQAMHTTGYRCSVEWSRLEPARGVWDEAAARHYRAMFTALKARGIKPLVTLHHFSNPQWVAEQGGWENPQTIQDFNAFVARCAGAFGDQVDDWVTLNEPTIYAYEAYVDGCFPPGRHNDLAAVSGVLGNLVKAHGLAYHTLHRLDPGARVGVAEHMVAFHPNWSWNPLDGLMAGLNEHYLDFNFLDAAATGQLRFESFLGRDYEDVPGLAGSLDFVGINYYTHSMASILHPFARVCDPASKYRTDLGLEVCADGLLDVLTRSAARYRKPIIITETGIADERRTLTPCFMVQYLSKIGEAVAAGVPVEGVYWWSLLDNFEWQNGYHGRFGLLAVDFTKPNRPRRWTPAAGLYARIAGENAIAPDLLARYGTGFAVAAPEVTSPLAAR